MDVIDWLLDGDPAIRWQVLRDLTDASPDEVAAERARVEHEGWGARLLALEGADGLWDGGACFPAAYTGDEPGQPWTATMHTLQTLQILGLDPASEAARRAIALVAEHGRWEHAGQRYFDGEVEPCINGRTIEAGAYFGVDVAPIVERILGERLADGGWNCEAENGSVRSSFDTTIDVLDGLLEFERTTGGSVAVREARRGGEEYLLERGLFRRKSTGEVVDPAYLDFAFPFYWHYDVLRALDYFRRAGGRPGSADGGGRRGRAVQAPARRPVAARPHPSRSRPLRPRGRCRGAQPVEHPPRPPGARLVGPRAGGGVTPQPAGERRAFCAPRVRVPSGPRPRRQSVGVNPWPPRRPRSWRTSHRRPPPSRSSSQAATLRSPKGDGDAPVQAYIAAMPGWKRDVGRSLDALIVRTVPDVRKAVKWNSPFYGVEGQGWFLNLHCFTKYVKVAFFRGTSLRPLPPASPSTRKCATSTSTRTTGSTKLTRRLGKAGQPTAG